MAIYTIIFYLSTALGQLFLTIPKDSEFFVFTVGSVLVLFSLITIAMTKIKEPILKPFEQYSFPKLYSIVPLALTGSFIGGFFVGSFFTMLPLTILHKFDSTTILSIFMSLTLIGGLRYFCDKAFSSIWVSPNCLIILYFFLVYSISEYGFVI